MIGDAPGQGSGATPPAGSSRLIDGRIGSGDRAEVALRPRTFDDYVGQSRVKENLRVFIRAATERGEALDHVLLHGPPGLGKTTLAHVIGGEAGVKVRTTSGPAIEKPGDLAALLTNLDARDVLFIDEIHRLSTVVEETLYPALEDFHLDLVIGQGPTARSVKYPLPPFTLIGATTRLGLLTGPLRARFGVTHQLEPYDIEELVSIVRRSAELLAVKADEKGLHEIARRSRGTPRVANRLLRRVRDFAQVDGDGAITLELARTALERLEIDDLGLDLADRRLLRTIHDHFRGGPVGLSTLAAALGEEKDTIEDIQEPYLIRLGLLERTARGRCLTASGIELTKGRLGGESASLPPGGQDRLF